MSPYQPLSPTSVPKCLECQVAHSKIPVQPKQAIAMKDLYTQIYVQTCLECPLVLLLQPNVKPRQNVIYYQIRKQFLKISLKYAIQ